MNTHLYVLFVTTVVAFMLIPGPNVALIIANTVSDGLRSGLLTVAGTSSAIAIQLVLVTIGMSELLSVVSSQLHWVRWLGAAYLVYLGVGQWRSHPADVRASVSAPKSGRSIYIRTIFVSLPNPKTLAFYGAFFPQFIGGEWAIGKQLTVLAVTFFMLAVVFDCCWAAVAGQVRTLLASYRWLCNRVAGTILIGAGIGLACARRS